jgi:hypothetical protein
VQDQTPSVARIVLLLATPFLFLGTGLAAVGEEIERGSATPAAFGLLVLLFGVLLTPLLSQLEAMVFGIEQRPWLGGRLRRWQRLILPYSTVSVLKLGLGFAFGGAAYLMQAPPGGNLLNILAAVSCAAGGALLGFAMSRLAVGLFIIRYSGLWAPSSRAWWLGGTVVVIGSAASAARSIVTTMNLSPVL